MLFEFLLGSPAFAEFVVAKVEAAAELSSKAKSAKLAKLDTSIAAAEKQLREERKREAIEEIEREFSEVA